MGSLFYKFHMHKLLILTGMILLSSCNIKEKKDVLESYSKTLIRQDATFLFDGIPSIVPQDDSSCYLYRSGTDIFYKANYLTGEKIARYSLADMINKDSICSVLFHTDTSANEYKNEWKIRQKYGYRPYTIMSVTPASDSTIAIFFTLHIPKIDTDKEGLIHAETLHPIIAIKHIAHQGFISIRPIDLKWVADRTKPSFSPDFGFFINGDTMYISALSIPEYDSSIYITYNLNTLIPGKKSAIRHQKFNNTTGLPLVTFYKFLKYNDRSFVSNRSQVYDLRTEQLIHDFKAEIKDIHSIYFFYPVDQSLHKWFINYTTRFDAKKTKFDRVIAIVDITAHQIISCRPDNTSIYSYYNNKIISIEKDSLSMYFKRYSL